MKKLCVFAVALITLFNCKEDKEFSTPSFEATKNNIRWSGEGHVAYNDEDGKFNIKGEIGAEVVILTTTNSSPGVYNLTSSSENIATFTDIDGTFYSTENEPDESLTVYPVGGTIIIDELSAENNSVTGRFQFSAFTDDGLQGITFSGDANRDNDPVRYGVFYRVNLFSGATITQTSSQLECDIAVFQYAEAAISFGSVNTTDPNYPTVCSALKAATSNRIAQCGDPNGILQELINALGTCQAGQGASSTCINTLFGVINAEQNFLNTNTSDANYATVCNIFRQFLEEAIVECGDSNGTFQDAINNLGTCM